MHIPSYKIIKEDDLLLQSSLHSCINTTSVSTTITDKQQDEQCHVRIESSSSILSGHFHAPQCRCSYTTLPLWKRYLIDFRMDMISFCLTYPIVAFFTLIALLNTARMRLINSHQQQHLDHLSLDEEITQDEMYYAERWGYGCQQHQVITRDGYILKMYRFYPQGQKYRKPVFLGHGLFQCSGAFVLNEKKSLVFALVDQGYDIWTGNNRAIGGLDHISLSPKDPCYWNWGLKELALQDFPAMLDHIRTTTGQERVAYIGHSQGNALVFIALSLQPELASKMSCFIALAPAVISGTLYFQFTPRPASTRLLSDWLEGWGKQGVCLYMTDRGNQIQESYDKIPLALIYGGEDYLVDGASFVRSFEGYDHHGLDINTRQLATSNQYQYNFSFPSLDLVHVERIPGYEHMDTIWAHDNHITTYPVIFNILNSARWQSNDVE
ncbi:Alpha/Beta hydrolase protein [Halteromyces radiatus]|uniref:Alpha/Beta hydrolase protein n=1 Tax=Halteromyces radiatus TaxID=101107 RepID=UPI00221F7F89|nr:Alpha/Beta hydrolase protein [Halteromyces radiatus]KAI8098739.1 Alpha/Beta hydrolase protein [Halteromyces radiatus]